MIEIKGETYLLACEAAKTLGVARTTFYGRYRELLQAFRIGARRRIHYRLSDIEQLNKAEPIVAQGG